MEDILSATALIVAIFSGLVSLINTLHIRKCSSGCCKSDCSKVSSPPNSPPPEHDEKKKVRFKDENHNGSMSV